MAWYSANPRKACTRLPTSNRPDSAFLRTRSRLYGKIPKLPSFTPGPPSLGEKGYLLGHTNLKESQSRSAIRSVAYSEAPPVRQRV